MGGVRLRLIVLFLLVGYAIVAAVIDEALQNEPHHGGTMSDIEGEPMAR